MPIFRRWLGLGAGCVAAWWLVAVAAPKLAQSSALRGWFDAARRHDIDAGALFYTEVDVTRRAEVHVRAASRR